MESFFKLEGGEVSDKFSEFLHVKNIFISPSHLIIVLVR